jgi:hypothetical protein
VKHLEKLLGGRIEMVKEGRSPVGREMIIITLSTGVVYELMIYSVKEKKKKI